MKQNLLNSINRATRNISANNPKTKTLLLCCSTYHQRPSSQSGIVRHFKALGQTLHLQTLQFLTQLKNNYGERKMIRGIMIQGCTIFPPVYQDVRSPCADTSYFSADMALTSRVTFCSASVISTCFLKSCSMASPQPRRYASKITAYLCW